MKKLNKLNKLFLVFCLSLMLLFSVVPVLAADETTKEESAVEGIVQNDLFNAIFYVSYYSLFDLDGSIYDCEDVESLMAAVAEVDQWARYYSPESYKTYIESLEGEKIGIGIYYLLEDGSVNVSSLVKGAAAEKAGVLAGDKIITVDGRKIADMTDIEVTAAFAGEEGTEVNITLLRGEQELALTLVRAKFTLQSVFYEVWEDNVGYVRIEHFTEQTGDELMFAYFDMMAQGIEGMILDLRFCPGGTMNGAVDVISLLCDADPAIILEYKDAFSTYDRSLSNMIKLPLVTLVNETSASASELVAGTLQDCSRSIIIGTQTYGKGVMQNVFSLPSGAGMAFTTAKYRTVGWQDVHEQNGIFPDIHISDYDAQTEKAIEILKLQQKVSNTLVFDYGSREVLCDNAVRSFNNAPFAYFGTSYLPLRETLNALGYEMFVQEGLIYISDGMERIILDPEASCATEKKLTKAVDCSVVDGVVYVGTSFWRDFIDCTLSWDEGTGSLTLSKASQQ